MHISEENTIIIALNLHVHVLYCALGITNTPLKNIWLCWNFFYAEVRKVTKCQQPPGTLTHTDSYVQ